jgi:hypothetical protein
LHQRQHHWRHQYHCEDLADDEAIGKNGGRQANSIRQPLPHNRWHCRLHHRDTAAHHDRRDKEDRHAMNERSESRADSRQYESDHQCRYGPDPRDQQ